MNWKLTLVYGLVLWVWGVAFSLIMFEVMRQTGFRPLVNHFHTIQVLWVLAGASGGFYVLLKKSAVNNPYNVLGIGLVWMLMQIFLDSILGISLQATQIASLAYFESVYYYALFPLTGLLISYAIETNLYEEGELQVR